MNKLEYVARSLSRGTKKVYETYVINAIYQKINNPNLEIETQKGINLENGYCPLIDLYLPQLKIAIEVDEGYHANEGQSEHDIWREKSINNQIQKSCVIDNIQFERIAAYDVSLEELNKRIDEVVSLIQKKIEERVNPLEWKDQQEKIEEIKTRGYIEADDCFDTNVQIINIVYGRNLRGFQRASYKLLWFPVISYEDEEKQLSSRATWQNIFNDTHTIIYERSIDERINSNKQEGCLKRQKEGNKRVVFVRDRDTFGKTRKRFVGVFEAGGWDDNKKAEIWKCVLTKIKIPIDEDTIWKL